jgi:hypothetical protein
MFGMTLPPFQAMIMAYAKQMGSAFSSELTRVWATIMAFIIMDNPDDASKKLAKEQILVNAENEIDKYIAAVARNQNDDGGTAVADRPTDLVPPYSSIRGYMNRINYLGWEKFYQRVNNEVAIIVAMNIYATIDLDKRDEALGTLAVSHKEMAKAFVAGIEAEPELSQRVILDVVHGKAANGAFYKLWKKLGKEAGK